MFHAFSKRRALYILLACFTLLIILGWRMAKLMIKDSAHYEALATEQQERERSIKAERGLIYDRNGVVLADNRTVCTISVVYNQVTDPETVISELSALLEMDENTVREKVEKYSSREIISTNVDKEVGDTVRELELDGVKVDEDYKRVYPYSDLASKILGFTGSDNQGIIGLEVVYDEELSGTDGSILTLTDSRGVEINGAAENRVEPEAGDNLYTSIDINIQTYATQLAETIMEEKNANSVSVLVMNPKNGEIYACVDVPEFDLNDPFTLTDELAAQLTSDNEMDLLNQMWRNTVVSDTYEPGSTFKIITASAALEEGVVSLSDTFVCNGSITVADRSIRCAKTTGHGTETFVQGIENSCNPVFIQVGLRLGVERFYDYFSQFNLLEKTGIDLPGEASTIMHNVEDMGDVELATCSFGQSFQLTRLRLLTTVCELINGGTTITPHIGVALEDADGESITELSYDSGERIVSAEVSETMRYLLECVVEEGGGSNAQIEGYSIGGKTATSEKLPRGTGLYISSFIGFAPADDPEVITLITIDEPEGTYYGGTIAAPVVKELYENILPYLGIDPEETEEESTESE